MGMVQTLQDCCATTTHRRNHVRVDSNTQKINPAASCPQVQNESIPERESLSHENTNKQMNSSSVVHYDQYEPITEHETTSVPENPQILQIDKSLELDISRIHNPHQSITSTTRSISTIDEDQEMDDQEDLQDTAMVVLHENRETAFDMSPTARLLNKTQSAKALHMPAPDNIAEQKSIAVTTGYFVTVKMKRIEKGNNLDESRVRIITANIGRGADAFVHMATYNGLEIALKEYKFKPREFTDERLSKFENELHILKTLGNHDNIVLFLGYRLNIKHTVLKFAFEFCHDGNLFNFIHPINQTVEYEYKDVLHILLDVAKAMEHTHSKCVIHRDLNPRNVLLFDRCGKAKLTDFGESVLVSDMDNVQLMDAHSVGTAGYKAPEMIKIDRKVGYGSKVDVFSFGSLCLELYTRTYISGQSELKDFAALKGNEHYLLIPDEAPEMFGQLIYECWQFDPAKRPTFAQIVNSLEAMS